MTTGDRTDIEAIKQRIDFVELVGRFVELRPVGARWMAPCPFHQETKPSFSVNPASGFYYCFGCQASGDVIDFYCAVHGLDFREGLAELAQEAGVELKKLSSGPQGARQAKDRQSRNTSLALHGLAQDFFVRALAGSAGEGARQYLAQRGVSQEITNSFGLGYSLDEWHALGSFLHNKGYSTEQATESGLLIQSKTNQHTENQHTGRSYDRFRGRLMFPIHNLSGKVIAFGARTLTGDDPKYLNSSDSPIYTKGEHLYGLFQARRSISHTKEILITEGYTDVLSLHQFGFTHACGVLGTALTGQQIQRLGGFTSRVVLLFDGDRAGRKAAVRSAEMILARGLTCRVVLLPEGEDVDSLLQQGGADSLHSLLDQATDGLEYCMQTVANEYAPKDIVQWARNFLSSLAQPDWQAWYVAPLARGLGLAENDLRRIAGKEISRKEKFLQQNQTITGSASMSEQRDRQFLRFAITHPQYIRELTDKGLGQALASSFAIQLWEKMAANPDRDIMQYLDTAEKTYWVQCWEMQSPASSYTADNALHYLEREGSEREGPDREGQEREWQEICTRLREIELTQERQTAMAALREAQRQQNKTEQRRLLQILGPLTQQLEKLRRLHEQH